MDKGDPKANCAAVVKGWPTAERHPGLASGPFLLDKAGIDVNKKIVTLTRNEKYWGEKPKLDRIILQGIGNDPGVSVKALRNNEVQMIYPQPQLDLVKNIKDLEPNITSKTNFGLSFEHLDFNTTDELLGQKVVRAGDRVRAEPAGHRGEDRGPVRQPRAGPQQPVLREQPAGVRGHQRWPLRQAGHRRRRSPCSRAPASRRAPDGIYAKDGKRLSFELMTTQANPLREQHDRRHHPAAEARRHRDQEVPQPGHLRGQGEAAQPRGRRVPDRPLRLGELAVRLRQPVDLRHPEGCQHRPELQPGRQPQGGRALPADQRGDRPGPDQDLGNQVDKLLWGDLYTLPLYQKPTFIAYNSNYTGIEENATNAGPLWDATKYARKA